MLLKQHCSHMSRLYFFMFLTIEKCPALRQLKQHRDNQVSSLVYFNFLLFLAGSPEDPVMDSAFAIDNVTGIITTQDSFLSLEDGIYFEMEVSAKDLDKSTGYSDTTNVFVSLFHIKV